MYPIDNPLNKSPYLHRGRAKHHLGNLGGANKDFAIYNHKNWQKEFLEMKLHSPSDVKLLVEGAKGLKDSWRLGALQGEYEKLKKIQEEQ